MAICYGYFRNRFNPIRNILTCIVWLAVDNIFCENHLWNSLRMTKKVVLLVNYMVRYFLQDISRFEHTDRVKTNFVRSFLFLWIFVANDGVSLSSIVTPRERETLALWRHLHRLFLQVASLTSWYLMTFGNIDLLTYSIRAVACN